MSDAPSGRAPRRFCPQCGAPDDRGSAFCTRCGTPLAAAPGPVAPPPAPARVAADDSGGRGPVLAISALVALAVVAAGAVAWSARGDGDGSLAVARTSTSPTARPEPSPSASAPSPSTSAPATAAPASPSPAAPASATTRVTGDVDGFGDAEGITPVLQRYVDGINRRDYAYAHEVLSADAKTRTSLEEFAQGNRSTQITSFVLDVVYTASAGGVVEASFVSRQDAVDGKDGQTCSRWTMTYTMVRADTGPAWRIDRAQPQGGSPLPC